MPSLLPEESYSYAFSMDKSYGQIYHSIGIPEIKWCSCMGEHGYVRGEEVVPPKLAIPPPIQVSGKVPISSSPTNDMRTLRSVCTDFPAVVNVGEEFPITVRVMNETGQTVVAQLQARDSALRGGGDGSLCVCSKSFLSLGTLLAGESIEVVLTVFPLCGGTHVFRSIVIVDTISGKEYPSGPLFRIMVTECDEMYDRWGTGQSEILSI